MNQVQRIQCQRLRHGSFNEFDGKKVAADLKEHEELWDGFVFGRFGYGVLIELRDIKDNYLNADTLYVLTTRDRLKNLLTLIEAWKANEIGWIVCKAWNKFEVEGVIKEEDAKEFGGGFEPGMALVRVWWD